MASAGAAGFMKPSFWDLHRQLADCYVADVASVKRQLSPNGTSQEEGNLKSLHDRRWSFCSKGLADGRRNSEAIGEKMLQRRHSHGMFRRGISSASRQSSEMDERRSGEAEAFSEQVLPRRQSLDEADARNGALPRTGSQRRLLEAPETPMALPAVPPLPSKQGEQGSMARGLSLLDDAAPLSRERLRSNTPSLLTLLELQGLVVPDDGDIMSVQLKPHGCWKEKKFDGLGLHSGTMRSRKILSRGGTSEKESQHVSWVKQMWLHPSGGFRTFWNSSVALLVLYDLLVIPLSVFDIDKNIAMKALDVSMPIFWTIDFVLTFFTSYYQHGELVTDLKRIARHYVVNWMLYDLGLIVLDWLFVVMDYFMMSDYGAASWSRSLLMLRILRLARIMRALKLRQGFAAFQDLLHSQAASLYVSFLTSLGQLLILNHWVACAWFGVRWLHPNDNWVMKSGMDQNYWTYQYLMCMLWSFCQLGVGESPLQPSNTTEMFLNCIIAFRALITTATLISTMSDLIAGLRSLREDEASQFRLLRRFLAQNQIPHDVSHKVTQFLQHQFANAQKARRSADLRVPLLDLLSRPLFRELQFERHRPSLLKLPMVKDVLEAPDIQTLEAVHSTTSSLYQLVAATGDIIFLSGSRASAAYFKLAGTVSYYRDQGEELVCDQCWVAEACLWTPWIHMGDLEAREVSDLLCLDSDGFCATLSKTWSTQQAASAYARQFLAAMRRDRVWSDVYIDHEQDSENGDVDLPADLPLVPTFCGFCRWKKRRVSARVQNILPKEDSEDSADLT